MSVALLVIHVAILLVGARILWILERGERAS
jgi:hypothetical protein